LKGVLGQEIDVPAKAGQAARKARTRVSYANVEIARSYYVYDKTLPRSLTLNAVRVEEIDAPEGIRAVEWLLLTTQATASLDDALRAVGWSCALDHRAGIPDHV
jgi:hypothetical protein